MKLAVANIEKIGHLPNCIIIGAQKCGTSSLHYYLSLHPEINMSSHKELNFFNQELCWRKGLDWYRSHFRGEAKIYGESSPHYTNYPLYKGVAFKMHSVIPQAKLIYLVRDPVERMVSQYLDRLKGGQETRPLEEALAEAQGDSQYLWFSKYYAQLEQFFPYYPKHAFLIVTAEQLRNNRRHTLQRIFHFLEVDGSFFCDEFSTLKNISDQKLKRSKPRRVTRYLAGGPRNPTLMRRAAYAFIPGIVKNAARRMVASGERVERPLVSQALRQRLLDLLYEDIMRLKGFCGYDFREWTL